MGDTLQPQMALGEAGQNLAHHQQHR
uniref:Uncharacterized protein n=1 Tax=Arundo donax TaxID=35708 RepID=A0A0A9B7K6_ARUDO